MSDTIRLLFVYVMAAIVVIGGGAMLFASRNEANTDFALLVAGFVGSAITFLFGQEGATRAVRSYQRGLWTPVPLEMPADVGPGVPAPAPDAPGG